MTSCFRLVEFPFKASLMKNKLEVMKSINRNKISFKKKEILNKRNAKWGFRRSIFLAAMGLINNYTNHFTNLIQAWKMPYSITVEQLYNECHYVGKPKFEKSLF